MDGMMDLNTGPILTILILNPMVIIVMSVNAFTKYLIRMK